MGLEQLLKACWRRRFRLFVGALVGAIVVAGIGSLLMSSRYDSSTDVAVAAVFPSSEVDSSGNQAAYSLQPDRFVSTQVEILSSQAAAARVASELHLTTDAVRKAVKVAQLGKSDVIRVSTSSSSPTLSAQIASHLADNYVAGVSHDTQDQFKLAVSAVEGQLTSVSSEIAASQSALNKNTPRSAAYATAQQRLTELQTQGSQLTEKRQNLLIQTRTATTSTRVVSKASADSAPVGIGVKSLAAYGAILGLAIMLCAVALTTTPGRAIDLEGSGDLDGLPIFGVLNPLPRGRKLPGMARGAERAYVRNLRVAGELTRIISLKGPIVVAAAGGPHAARQVEKLLGPLASTRGASRPHSIKASGREVGAPAENGSSVATAARPQAPATAPATAQVIVQPLVSLLQGRPPEQVVVLAVDIERVTRVEVDEVLASLRTFGADILGVIGIR